MTRPVVHPIEIAGIKRELPLLEIKPGVHIAILNILGDTELVHASAKGLAAKIDRNSIDLIVTAEAKAIPLAYALSYEMKIPYIVLRKAYKPYMGDALEAETLSITTGAPQTLYLDSKDRKTVKDKRILLLDDVISTGSTLQGMRLIMNKAGARIVAESAILTEGDRAQWHNIIALGHIPVWVDGESPAEG